MRELRSLETRRESTPISILIMLEMIGDLLPPGVLNVVNGFGREAGMPLANNRRIAKNRIYRFNLDWSRDCANRGQQLDPNDPELGGKSRNVFLCRRDG